MGLKNLAALENPIADRTKKHPEEWYHGSPRGFDEFDDPARYHDQNEEEESGRFNHWNTLLGNHFTSDHAVARDFSEGQHSSTANESDDDEGPLGHVIHVKLHLKNPKVYASEHDMDQEVYEHEHGENRNFQDNYAVPGDDDEDDEWSEPDYAARNRRQFKGDSQRSYSPSEPDESFPYGFHPKATGWLNTHPDKEGIARRYKERMQRAGYDGIVYGNEYENSSHGKQALSAIAFEPHQIEITQHHYGGRGCLSPQEAAERKPPPRGQMTLPGLEDLPRTLPKEHRPDLSKEWPETWTPHYFEHGRAHRPSWGDLDLDPKARNQTIAGRRQSYDTGRLWAPLPQECWDRYYGRHTGAQRRTAKTWTMKHLTYAPEGGYIDKETEVEGPFYHGSRSKRLAEGASITPGRKTNPWGDEGAKSQHVFFTTELRTAADYAHQAGGHVYEVEPTGNFSPDYGSGDYKTKSALKVVRKLDPQEWSPNHKVSAIGEESARQHAGKQDVYAVRSGNGMVNLCKYHAETHVSNSRAADSLAEQTGIGSRERSAEILGEPRKGSCAACNRDTTYQLKLLTPRWMQNASDSRTRRRPDKPMRTKPLPSLKQSENVRRAVKGDLFHADSGKVRFHPEGTPRNIGDHTIPAGAEVHTDENEAWNKAIEHWKSGRTDFPRVYVAHEPQAKNGRLTHEAEASELDYDHERHPVIRSENEEPHEPIMYHGSTRSDYDEPPEEITPSGGGASFGPGVADPSYAYATPSLKDAWRYAEKRVENGLGGKPVVYRVTPHDPKDVEEDPSWTGDSQTGHSRGTMEHDKRSKKGFEVLDEVPMSQHQEHEWSQSPFNDEASDDWDEDDDHHYGSLKTLADWDDEDDDYEPDECEHCGEDKNSEDHAEVHHDWLHDQKWHTNWDEDREVGAHNNGEIQRGMAISLPKDVHRIVHDEDRPLEERGRALAEHVIKSANDQGHIGRFWTDEDSVAQNYATGSRVRAGSKDDNKTPATPVTLHVKFPGYHHIETDPDELEHHGVYSYHIENNREVPLQHGTPLEAVGVSWAHHKYGDDGPRHWDSDSADWKRHTFKEPIKAMSSKKKLPTLRMLAHDATENEAIRHCFTGDTRYLTAEGVKSLAETVGTVQRVLTGTRSAVHSGRWVEAMIHEFGEQPVLQVTLKRNKQTKIIRATAEHRWLVRRPDRIVLTQHLRPGHRLAHLRAPFFEGDPDREGIRMGAVFGDGYIARQAGRTYGGITLWGAKRDLAKYFDDVAASEPRTYVTESGVQGLRYQSGMAGYTKQLPELTESLSYLRGWLMGYFATDGHVSARGQVTLSSASLETLLHVRDVANLLGIGTYAPTSKLRRGYGAEPTLIHEMGFSATDLSPSFFLRDDQRAAWRLPAQERFGWTVVSVEDHGETETVYCPRVPETESFVLEDNIHTMNCPFCGGGKIIGRADGTVECEFCHHYFTVQVQPQYPNFPQTVNGVPQDIPGMPGQVEQPGIDGGAGGGFPPGEDEQGGDDAPPWAQDGGQDYPDDAAEEKQADDEDDDDQPPPFAKKSSAFRTATGALLTEDDYVRHLAIRFAPDRDAMIARIREERGA